MWHRAIFARLCFALQCPDEIFTVFCNSECNHEKIEGLNPKHREYSALCNIASAGIVDSVLVL